MKESYMKFARLFLLSILLLLCGACGSGSAATLAQESPTVPPVPTPPSIPSHIVTFSTADHVNLTGLLYGQSKTVVICSHMNSSSLAGWRDSGMPERIAALGYQVLLYDFRGYGGSDGEADPSLLNVDLNAAISFARKQGATRIILMGESMGGAASLAVAAKTPVEALVLLSSPQSFGVGVSDPELKTMDIPKLFIASADDEPFPSEARHMYDLAPTPKEIYIYPGLAHGTLILGGNNGDGPAQRILHFIQRYAPAS